MNNQKINIYGASGHAKVVIDIIESMDGVELGYIFDDDPFTNSVLGYKVYSPNEVDKLQEYPICFAIGKNSTRVSLVEKYNFIFSKPLIHSTAIISKTVQIGNGTVVMANAVINPSAVIGEHCIINTGAIVEHDVVINDFVHISPNATITGGVSIEKSTQIGAAAVVLPNLNIGINVIVGAGSVVTKNTENNVTLVGNPCKILQKKKM
ncbi:acetyltransferase [Croceibacter atlanticus]|uniref:acetyltransferase n=1 Tax=Croceibacter atlanticus TaxID=313588 RepID=UPI0024B96E81|nr:acetyltransferase [Croceibacter atlanticus]